MIQIHIAFFLMTACAAAAPRVTAVWNAATNRGPESGSAIAPASLIRIRGEEFGPTIAQSASKSPPALSFATYRFTTPMSPASIVLIYSALISDTGDLFLE